MMIELLGTWPRRVGPMVTVGVVGMGLFAGACASAPEPDDDVVASSEDALDSACNGKGDGEVCGSAGVGRTTPKVCDRGHCRQVCGSFLGSNFPFNCPASHSCMELNNAFYPGNGNVVAGLCFPRICIRGACRPAAARTRCDNDVALNGCAYNGASRYKCVNPTGRSQAGVANSQWESCNVGSGCTCNSGASRCDNNVDRNDCAIDQSTGARFKCVNPGGESRADVANSQWERCTSSSGGCCAE